MQRRRRPTRAGARKERREHRKNPKEPKELRRTEGTPENRKNGSRVQLLSGSGRCLTRGGGAEARIDARTALRGAVPLSRRPGCQTARQRSRRPKPSGSLGF